MTTDEEKCKLAKLLQDLEVQEMKLPERCNALVKEFHEKYINDIDNEDFQNEMGEIYENPYIPDKNLLEENQKKLKELLAEGKREKKIRPENINLSSADPKRPWRTHSNKEKLLRIDNELKQHKDKAGQAIAPLGDDKIKDLVKECQEESFVARPVGVDRLRETVEEARKKLPNFQYKNILNSTATALLPSAQSFISTLNVVGETAP